jgi:hypothetical protein
MREAFELVVLTTPPHHKTNVNAFHTEPEFQVSKSIVTFMVRQTIFLRAGRDEDTNHFLFTRIVLSQAYVYPAVFRFARRKVSSKNGFAVL